MGISMKANPNLLLTIDFINDIVHPAGKMASSAHMVAAQRVLEKTNDAITFARKHGIPVAHVKVGFPAAYANCPANSSIFSHAMKNGALQLDTWGTDFHQMLSVLPEDFFVVKSRISPFYGTTLETLLRAAEIKTIAIAGVSTNMAVESMVREAHDRDYQSIVLADCCAAATEDTHRAALAGAIARVSHVTTSDMWISSAANTF